jgi:hypothetical protein
MEARRGQKKTGGPDSMAEMWSDQFSDALPGGKLVNRQEMMDMIVRRQLEF